METEALVEPVNGRSKRARGLRRLSVLELEGCGAMMVAGVLVDEAPTS